MTDDEYNIRFNELNPQIPRNLKWTAKDQRAYYEQLLRSMVAKGGTQYKDPNDYTNQTSVPATPTAPVQPSQPAIANITSELTQLLYNAEYQVSKIKELMAKQVK